MARTVSPPVTLDSVSRVYGTARALDRVSVVIEPGEMVAVIGRSGAGKTTLLRCLAGATALSAGAIRFGAQDLATLRGRSLRAHRARVGMVYQQFNLVRRLPVLDNVLVGRLSHLRGWHRWASLIRWFDRDDREIAFRCLAHVGLLDRAWQRADTLSGGEQQRVAIARVLAQGPDVVLADEPIASLDLANGAQVMETLRDVAHGAGLTVVATLHNVGAARRFADRVLGLRRGRLVFDDVPQALDDAVLARIFEPAPTGTVAGTAPVADPEWALP